MATQNEYGLVWMNSNQMIMPDGNGMHQHVPSDMMAMDQGSQMDSSYYPMSVPPSFDTVSQQPMELDGFLMLDDFEGDYCGEPPRYMTAATQTIPSLRRKIMPVKHPGLKLQTPIAFKCDTDPNVIPIKKDGMAICEKCGAIGVKHAFYTRHRKYCSLACARGLLGEGAVKDDRDLDDDSMHSQENSNPPICKYPNGTEIKDDEFVTKEVISIESMGTAQPNTWGPGLGTFPFTSLELPEDRVPSIPSARTKHELSNSYNWLPKLENPNFSAAPVNCFKHAPMADCWDDIMVGMKVEVENADSEECAFMGFTDSFWVATVKRIAGYKALLRYDGFKDERDFWVNLCSCNVHPVGWCATRGKPLIPPRTIAENCKDWKDFLVRRLTGARTLPSSFYSRVTESLKSRFRVGLILEVVDKDRICQMCVATVKRIIGKRLHLVYYNANSDDAGFWCHEDSPLIHPVGWSVRVGHEIDAPENYIDHCESGLFGKDDACEELFTGPFQSVTEWKTPHVFEEGMKLEAIDPLNLTAICAATVMKVLQDGYLMIRIDSYSEEGNSEFCYHSSSPCIFPPGFCHDNGIPLAPPIKHSPESFSWQQLAANTGCILAPETLFHREMPEHGIAVGMQLESADLMDPRLVCVATVSRVVGRLVKIHFDGWDDDYDQWMDSTSPDLYPVGWCSLVCHKLEAPPGTSPRKTMEPEKKKPGRHGKRMRGRMKGRHYKKQLHVESDVKEKPTIMEQDPEPIENEPPAPSTIPANVEVEAPEIAETASEIGPSLSSGNTSLTPVPSTSSGNGVFIPRLADPVGSREAELNPSLWTSQEVAQFLRLNDCGVYADNFIAEEKTGVHLLTLTEDEIMRLTTGKIGPTLKIKAVIEQLNKRAAKASRKINL